MPPTDPPKQEEVLASLLTQVERVRLDELVQFPGNPNVGDVGALTQSLKNNELFAPPIVQKSTGYILSLNHVTQAARELGWTHMDVIRIDVDDQHAKRIVAAANRTAELSRRNDYLLAELLRGISDSSTGLDGTGYDDAFLDDLIERTEPPLENAGLPEAAEDDTDYVMPTGPTGAHDAESDQDAQRNEHAAAEGPLAEVVVVMPADDKAQLLRDIAAMREHLGDQPTGALLQAAARIAGVVLDSARTGAPPADWDHLLRRAAVRPDTRQLAAA